MKSVDRVYSDLLRRGFTFSLAPGDHEVRYTVLATYGWPGHVDSLHIRAEDDATASRVRDRDDGHGLFSDQRVVWSYEGTFLAAAAELLHLPAPGERGAPDLTGRTPSGLWLPRSLRLIRPA
ncbi:hypothetical protein [Actinoalloteichus sp. GBA129-24]|uniref:hypothetical protein n=1 Tax=Actinoalloteichus sp. GBA129-24 TaxID=1612551 RepID=UPI00095097EB|nr:hypothetical protein [Actinoalloteichus sp. GBA129-24]APU22932.1 hypothetical protein UA75_24765 [Actinoalloteichus sp. GBA129-24]